MGQYSIKASQVSSLLESGFKLLCRASRRILERSERFGVNVAYLKTIAPEDATGELKEIYDAAFARAGRVFNIVRVQSLNPPVLDASIRLYARIMLGPSSLSRVERELLATVTSWANRCHY